MEAIRQSARQIGSELARVRVSGSRLDDSARGGDLDLMPPDPGTSYVPYRVYNIGNHEPVELMTFIEAIERAAGRPAVKNFLPMQAGDVVATYADVADLQRDAGFEPRTPLAEGIEKFVAWYRGYYH